jgi:hypothetical protein
VLTRILGNKREEVAGSWRRLHNEELHSFYGLPNVFRLIKSRRMRLAGHAALIRVMWNAYTIFVGKSEGKSRSENLGVSGKINVW